jgi:hypothetical protein
VNLLQTFVPDDVPLDVADDAAKIGLELAQAPVGAFELMGMGVTLVQAHPKLLSQAHQPLARPVQLAQRLELLPVSGLARSYTTATASSRAADRFGNSIPSSSRTTRWPKRRWKK